MSKLEIIKDIEDKDHLIFNNSNLNQQNNIGDKIEDFEILMLVGGGAFGTVFKVRSKLDNKIYAMKKIDVEKVGKEKGELSKIYCYREAIFLPKLSHPHIIKFYHSFEESNFLYIFTEYVRNGDMCDLINIHRELNKPFKEEELWYIFYQCIDSLLYIHKEGGIIHRDIKPLNIFIDDNLKIKIGDFGVSALDQSEFERVKFKYLNDINKYLKKYADKLMNNFSFVGTEGYQGLELISKKKYNQKFDVFSMGTTFFELVYFHTPLINSEKDQKIREQYSDKLIDIINKMRQEEEKNRCTSAEAYEYIEKEYFKISKNSSIFSLITCLSSFKDLNNSLNIKKTFANSYKEFLGFLSKRAPKSDEEGWKDSIKKFRESLSKENIKFEGINEIRPSFLFTFIIEKLYEEYEETVDKKIVNKNFKDGPHLINSVDDSEIRNEGEARVNFDNYFVECNEEFNNNYIKENKEEFISPIIKNFRGLIKQTNVCNKCEFKTYSFSSYFFANFDLNEISKNNKITLFDLEENFKTENNMVKILYCEKCLKKYEHKCKKEYYSFPNLLVISLKRGIKEINQTEVNLKEFIELKDLDKNDNNKKKYQLVGLIKKIGKTEEKDEQYYSNFSIDGKWFNYEKKEKIYESHPPFEKAKPTKKKVLQDGDIVMLFYILKSK